MLTALQDLSTDEAQKALAAISLHLMAIPGVPSDARPPVDQELLQRVLGEIEGSGGPLSRSDPDVRMARLFDRLAKELSGLSLKGRDSALIIDRLGSKGALPFGKYKIQVAREFRESANEFRVTVQQAKQFARVPTRVQHLEPQANELHFATALTILSKVIADEGGKGPELILILGARRGRAIDLRSAWRIRRDAVPWNPNDDPYDVLLRFLDRFGIEIDDGVSPPTKFLLHGVYTIDQWSRASLSGSGPAHVLAIFLIRPHADRGLVEVAFGLVVDLDKYHRSLRAD
jgi:hypothetical protein